MPVKLPVTSEIALGRGKGQIVSDLGLTRATHHLGIFPCRVHESEPQNVQVQRCENLNKEVTAKDSENGETQLCQRYIPWQPTLTLGSYDYEIQSVLFLPAL